jgi:hypothetical protein
MKDYTTGRAFVTPFAASHQNSQPHCAVCSIPYLKGGSFVFVGGLALCVCVTDAKTLALRACG